MTPAEHYRRAEQLAGGDPQDVQTALVHAILFAGGAAALGPLAGYDTARDMVGDAIDNGGQRKPFRAPWAVSTPAGEPQTLEDAEQALEIATANYRDALDRANA